MENYFNYFTEVEAAYQRRRGSALLLSTLDWALIETWKTAGIPLAAVLRGIDATFDKYDRKPARAKTRKVNSLAFCAQEVLAAAADMTEAAAGSAAGPAGASAVLETAEIVAYLRRNAERLRQATGGPGITMAAASAATALETLANALPASAEDLERHLTVLEEKLLAALLSATPDAELVAVRAEADRDIAPYRSKMAAAQITQLHRQYTHKRLLETAKLPRLSLFYM